MQKLTLQPEVMLTDNRRGTVLQRLSGAVMTVEPPSFDADKHHPRLNLPGIVGNPGDLAVRHLSCQSKSLYQLV